MAAEVLEFEVADGEANNGGFIQLRGNGRWQWQHLSQLIELIILLSSSGTGSISGFLFS